MTYAFTQLFIYNLNYYYYKLFLHSKLLSFAEKYSTLKVKSALFDDAPFLTCYPCLIMTLEIILIKWNIIILERFVAIEHKCCGSEDLVSRWLHLINAS